MTKENPFAFLKKSVFYQILRKKISILRNSKGKKSVYTDKISMSGRSDHCVIVQAILFYKQSSWLS